MGRVRDGNCVGDAPNVVAALCFELSVDERREKIGQEIVDDVVEGAIYGDWKFNRDVRDALGHRHREEVADCFVMASEVVVVVLHGRRVSVASARRRRRTVSWVLWAKVCVLCSAPKIYVPKNSAYDCPCQF